MHSVQIANIKIKRSKNSSFTAKKLTVKVINMCIPLCAINKLIN